MVGDELRTEHALNLVMDDMASLELVTGFEVKLGTLVALDGMAAQGLAYEVICSTCLAVSSWPR